MPGVMPGNITQGYLLATLANFINNGSNADLVSVLNDLNSGVELHNILLILNGYRVPGYSAAEWGLDRTHFEADWCPSHGGSPNSNAYGIALA